MTIEKEVNDLLKEMKRAMPGVNKYEAQSMEIEHGNPESKEDTFESINRKVGKASGVYIYHNKDKVYYVGKAKLGASSGLADRMKCHYKESVFNEEDYQDGRKGIAGDKWRGDYPAYFRDHLEAGSLIVTWVQIDGDYDSGEFRRKAVEAALTDQLKPEFVNFDKNRKEKRKHAKKTKN
jgi:hypothetical protein